MPLKASAALMRPKHLSSRLTTKQSLSPASRRPKRPTGAVNSNRRNFLGTFVLDNPLPSGKRVFLSEKLLADENRSH